MCLHKYQYFKCLLTYCGIRDSKFALVKVSILSDSLSLSNQTTPVPQVEVVKLENSSVDLPQSSPTPHTQSYSTSLECESDVCNEVLSPHPPFLYSFYPPNCQLLFSAILNVSLNVHEDQVLDGIGVPQKACDVIYDVYVRESTSEQEYAMKADLSPSYLSLIILTFPMIMSFLLNLTKI